MKTMLLDDGDLVPAHRDFKMVTGTGKVAQDLRVALLEPLGIDRFHPGWGSALGGFIASIASPDLQSDIEAEVNRVISNYAAIQRDKVEADINGDRTTRFTSDEILSRVQSVQVKTTDETVRVRIVLQTASGEVVLLSEAVS